MSAKFLRFAHLTNIGIHKPASASARGWRCAHQDFIGTMRSANVCAYPRNAQSTRSGMLSFANASVLHQPLTAQSTKFGVQVNASAFALSNNLAPLIFIGTIISASASVKSKSVLRTCTGTIIHANAFACIKNALKDTILTPILANVNAFRKFASRASSGTVIYANVCAFSKSNAPKVFSGVQKNVLVYAYPRSVNKGSTSTALSVNVFALLKIALTGLPGVKQNAPASVCQQIVQLASILIGIFANAIAHQKYAKLHWFGIVTSAIAFVHLKIAYQGSTGTKLIAFVSVFRKNVQKDLSGMMQNVFASATTLKSVQQASTGTC